MQVTFVQFNSKSKKIPPKTSICGVCMDNQIGKNPKSLHFTPNEHEILCKGILCAECMTKLHLCPFCRGYWSEEDKAEHQAEIQREQDARSASVILEMQQQPVLTVIELPAACIITVLSGIVSRQEMDLPEEQANHTVILVSEELLHENTKYIFLNKLILRLIEERCSYDMFEPGLFHLHGTNDRSEILDEYYTRWISTGKCSCPGCSFHRLNCSRQHSIGTNLNCIFYGCATWGVHLSNRSLILCINVL